MWKFLVIEILLFIVLFVKRGIIDYYRSVIS